MRMLEPCCPCIAQHNVKRVAHRHMIPICTPLSFKRYAEIRQVSFQDAAETRWSYATGWKIRTIQLRQLCLNLFALES